MIVIEQASPEVVSLNTIKTHENIFHPDSPKIPILATKDITTSLASMETPLSSLIAERHNAELNERLRHAKEGMIVIEQASPEVVSLNTIKSHENIIHPDSPKIPVLATKDIKTSLASMETPLSSLIAERHDADVEVRDKHMLSGKESRPNSPKMIAEVITPIPNSRKEIQAVTENLLSKETLKIESPLEPKKQIEDPNDDTSDFISEEVSGYEEPHLPTTTMLDTYRLDAQITPELAVSNNMAVLKLLEKDPVVESKPEIGEDIYVSDFEDIESSTGSATTNMKSSPQVAVKVGTAEKFVVNVVDNFNTQMPSSSVISDSFASAGKDIDIPIRMVSTSLLNSLTESIFVDLLKESVNFAIAMKPKLPESVILIPPVNQVETHVITPQYFPLPISTAKELDYNTILGNGCTYVIEKLKNILPEGSYYWDPPRVTSKLLPELPDLVRSLLVDSTNEALYECFEKQRFYDDPRTKCYQKKTVKPKKVSRDFLLQVCDAKFEEWRMHSLKHGINLDALLIDTVKTEGKILCNILNDEVFVKNALLDDIFHDLLEDTALVVHSLIQYRT
jgi:hypothetical protein